MRDLQVAPRPGFALGVWRRIAAHHGQVAFLREVFLLLGLYAVYLAARKLILTFAPEVGPANALKVVHFEQAWGFFWEPSWQRWAVAGSGWVPKLFNQVYIFGFLPLVGTTAVVVYLADRKRYFTYRNVIFISFAFALGIFALFPMAPPRMTEGHGFIDTITVYGPSWYDTRNTMSYYNAFAAMPSLHFGWAFLFGVLFFRWGPAWLKVLGVAYPAAMFFAITITGNHYILDAVAGMAVMGASCLVYNLVARRAGLLGAKAPRPDLHRWGASIGPPALREPDQSAKGDP